MPVRKVKVGGKTKYQYGTTGKKYSSRKNITDFVEHQRIKHAVGNGECHLNGVLFGNAATVGVLLFFASPCKQLFDKQSRTANN